MVPVATMSMMAHHTNYTMPPNHRLFASDFIAGQVHVFDLTNPQKPRLVSTFGDAAGYSHEHSFASLSNGHTLATFQIRGRDSDEPGALVEFDQNGHLVRASDASAPQIDPNIRPYSLEAIESLDRVITTSHPMSPLKTKEPTHVVQVWRLSDLKLLKTIDLPKPPIFDGVAAEDSDAAKLLTDGKTVLVKTTRCGLFELTGVSGTDPQAKYVYDFGGRSCAGVPVVAGKYWIQSSLSGHDLTALDVSDPSHPAEVSHLYLGPEARPHWLAIEPGTGNLVITGYGSLLHRISFAKVDLQTGALSLDPRTIDLNRSWPDGWNGPATPHGTLFY
jgi:hypothetical protein